MKAPFVCTANLAASVPPRALLTGCLHGMHMSSLLSPLWSKPTGFSQGETLTRLTVFFSRVAQTEEPVMSWTRLCPGQFSNHPGRLHAHGPPCCAAEPKTPSRPAAKTSCWQEATQSFSCLENLKIKAIIDPGPVGLYRELRGDPGQVLHSMKVASALQRVLVLSVVVTSQPVAMSNELMVPPRHFPQRQQTRSLCQVANTAFPFFSLRLFLDFANYFFPVAQCSGSKALGTLWSCRSG